MNTTDVQVYDYMMDNGRKISISLSLFGEIEMDRRVTASIHVDGEERFHSSTHFNLPAGVPLGEWMGYAVTSCLITQLRDYTMWMITQNLMVLANADEEKPLPVDDRHIPELTDEKAEWWTEPENHELLPFLHHKLGPLVEKAIAEYPQLQKEN